MAPVISSIEEGYTPSNKLERIREFGRVLASGRWNEFILCLVFSILSLALMVVSVLVAVVRKFHNLDALLLLQAPLMFVSACLYRRIKPRSKVHKMVAFIVGFLFYLLTAWLQVLIWMSWIHENRNVIYPFLFMLYTFYYITFAIKKAICSLRGESYWDGDHIRGIHQMFFCANDPVSSLVALSTVFINCGFVMCTIVSIYVKEYGAARYCFVISCILNGLCCLYFSFCRKWAKPPSDIYELKVISRVSTSNELPPISNPDEGKENSPTYNPDGGEENSPTYNPNGGEENLQSPDVKKHKTITAQVHHAGVEGSPTAGPSNPDDCDEKSSSSDIKKRTKKGNVEKNTATARVNPPMTRSKSEKQKSKRTRSGKKTEETADKQKRY